MFSTSNKNKTPKLNDESDPVNENFMYKLAVCPTLSGLNENWINNFFKD